MVGHLTVVGDQVASGEEQSCDVGYGRQSCDPVVFDKTTGVFASGEVAGMSQRESIKARIQRGENLPRGHG